MSEHHVPQAEWNTFDPTWGGLICDTCASYWRGGRLVVMNAQATVQQGLIYIGALTMTLPLPARSLPALTVIGAGNVFDVSALTHYSALVVLGADPNEVTFVVNALPVGGVVAAGDTIQLSASYETTTAKEST